MAEIQRETLFGKLHGTGYQSLLAAIGQATSRGNPTVELVHWIWQILQQPDSDFQRILEHFQIDPSRVHKSLTESLDRLPHGASQVRSVSTDIEDAVEQGWKYATLMFSDSCVRTGHLVVALLKARHLRPVFLALAPEFDKIKLERLTDEFSSIVQGSGEDKQDKHGTAGPRDSASRDATATDPRSALARFSVDLTEKARRGEIDPITGRDEEIRQLIDILMRRRQNNPILTGEAGVGKTAVVEGFAQRIVAGEVPPDLKAVSVRALDLGALQAGASMKGEFEQRLRSLVEEVEKARWSEHPVVLFIDEAHTLVGAGGAAGTGDAANFLKPALARGTLRVIAATTWNEYKLHIEKDTALTRRFQVVKIDEPDEARAVLMLRGLVSTLEKHHKVQILDQAIEAAVRLSHRYIPARQLPDKAVSLIDTAAARAAISQHVDPAALEDSSRRLRALELEREILLSESRTGLDHKARLQESAVRIAAEQTRQTELKKRCSDEQELVAGILDLRGKLRARGAPLDAAIINPNPAESVSAPAPGLDETPDVLLSELRLLQQKLAELQGESPLIFPAVDSNAVAAVVADWTGIPVGRMRRNEIDQVLQLADLLEKRVIGQRHALETIANRICTTRAGLDNPNRPIGVFLLVGPSGVGKTETALALAEALYGGEHSLITFNMSEFQDEQSVSTLKGAPPGLVGYGKGGVLTEAVRRRPYSVVLLDEFEKAHLDVHEFFFQVFEKGWMEDAEGVYIDFKNTIILVTTNAAQDVIISRCKEPELKPHPDALEQALREPLKKTFKDALLNRLLVIPYYPVTPEMLRTIIKLNLARLEKRVLANHKVPFTYTEAVPELISERCAELERGARIVDALITNTILPAIGREILTRLMNDSPIRRVHIDARDGQFSYAFD
jgi:type VI secretion system protein VasG